MYLLKHFLHRMNDSIEAFKEEGIRHGFAQLGQTGARMVHLRADYVVMAKLLTECRTLPEPRPGLVIHQATTSEEVAWLCPITNTSDMARFHKLLDNKSVSFIAYQGGEAIGYCWISREVDRSSNRIQAALPLHPGDGYVHDLLTSPAHRGRGVGQSLFSHCLRYMREHGYARAVSAARKDDIAALTVHRKTGYQEIGELHHSRILFWDRFEYDGAEG